MNMASDVDAVTKSVRLFHTRAAATGKAVVSYLLAGPILSVFPALIVHSELKSVHPGFPVAFIF